MPGTRPEQHRVRSTTWGDHEGMANRLQYRRQQRLHLQRDFDRVFARRCNAGDNLLVVYAAGNDLPYSRLGMRTGRRQGPAVVRNRIRRRLREAFRLRQYDLPSGLDVVCIPQPGASAQAATADYERSLAQLMVKVERKLRCQRS